MIVFTLFAKSLSCSVNYATQYLSRWNR